MSPAVLPPADVVEGIDPVYQEVLVTIVDAVRITCACGFTTLSTEHKVAAEQMNQHLRFGHPAWRNPEIACQATAPWDHERWCGRPKGHEGKHWTPSLGGGMEWSA